MSKYYHNRIRRVPDELSVSDKIRYEVDHWYDTQSKLHIERICLSPNDLAKLGIELPEELVITGDKEHNDLSLGWRSEKQNGLILIEPDFKRHGRWPICIGQGGTYESSVSPVSFGNEEE